MSDEIVDEGRITTQATTTSNLYPAMSTARSLIVCFICLRGTLAFQMRPLSTRHSPSSVWGKVKRGKLGREVDAAAAPVRSNKNKAATTGSKKLDANISPALAEWMASQEDGSTASKDRPGDGNSATTTTSSSSSSSSASTYTNFHHDDNDDNEDDSSNKRKMKPMKQSARKAAEDARDERVKVLVKELQGSLESKAPIDIILNTIREIIALPAANFKQLSASAARQDFRLAWVGSDDAVCHVGTGLHKVPLARLQEVFLSFCGRNRIEIQEVIRILGPFPNVKNTLQGQSSFTRDLESDIVQWRVTWDSMVDGTGKEILAGKDENIQRVDLQVYFSSPAVLIAVVPPNTDNYTVKRVDPLENKGQHVLVFVREDNLNEQLEALRVG